MYHGAWVDERCRLCVQLSCILGYMDVPWVVVNFIKWFLREFTRKTTISLLFTLLPESFVRGDG